MSVRFHSHLSSEIERDGTELVAEDEFSLGNEVRMYPMQHGSSYNRSLFSCPRCTRRDLCLFILNTSLLAALVLAGFLMGYYMTKSMCENDPIRDYDPTLARQLLDLVDAKRIRDTVEKISGVTHVAGTPSNLEVYRWIYQQVTQFTGFATRVFTYDVLLQQPKIVRDSKGVPRSSNTVELLDAQDAVISSCLDCAPRTDDYVPFTAFSATGEFTGQPVFINFGRVVDFQRLKNESIDCTGKVLIARLGEVTRGTMAWRALYDFCRTPTTAEPRLALLVYPDPSVYPNALPNETSSGVNRYMSAFGDLLTPGLPSVNLVHREVFDDVRKDVIPNVLIQPISWHFATILMRYF